MRCHTDVSKLDAWWGKDRLFWSWWLFVLHSVRVSLLIELHRLRQRELVERVQPPRPKRSSNHHVKFFAMDDHRREVWIDRGCGQAIVAECGGHSGIVQEATPKGEALVSFPRGSGCLFLISHGLT